MLNSCPKCKNSDLHIYTLTRAILHSMKDQSGSVQLSLLEWGGVEQVEHYECLNCGYIFCGENIDFQSKAKEF